LDESSSAEEDIFGLDENVESLALDELGANESLEDLSLTEDLDESSSEEEDIFGLDESAESLEDLSLTEDLDESSSEEEDIFGLEESAESLALDELDANESLEDLPLTEDSDSSELVELEVLEENESLEDFSPTEELDELDVLDTDQSNELVSEESEELDTFESSSEMIPELENQEEEDISIPQDSDDFDLMMGTETSRLEEDSSRSDTSVDDFFNVSDSNLSAPSYSPSIDSDDFFTSEPIALDPPSKSSISHNLDGRVRDEEDSRCSSELASETSQSESQEESDNQSLLEENHELTEELVNENLESIDLESTAREDIDLNLEDSSELDGLNLEAQESDAISEEVDLDLGEDSDLDALSLETQESDAINEGMDLDLGEDSDLDALSLETQVSDSISEGMDLDLGEDSDLEGLSLEAQESDTISEEMDLDLGEDLDLEGLSLEAQESDTISEEMDLDLGEDLDLDLDGLSLEAQESDSISEEMDLDLGEGLDLVEAQESDSISEEMDLDLGEDLDGLSLEVQESDSISISEEMDLDLGEDLDLDGLSLEAQESDTISEEMDLDLGEDSDLNGLSLEAPSDSISEGMDLDLGLMIDSDEDPSQNTLIQEIDDFGLGEPLNPDPLDLSSDFTEDAGLDLDETVIEEPSEGLDGLDFSLEIEENAPDDLSTLFSDEPEMLGDEESLEDLNELTLFEEDLGSTDETLESLDFGDDLNPLDSSSRQWQELEAFLGEDQKQRENIEIFTQLETFLDEPVTLPSPSLRQEVSGTPAETLETTEGEFDDLEDLLADADQALGGPPTANATTARSPKAAKRVEQNMRVPIKQLDNLSNLVGELVVNRNSLEQNQERLRQCLDNLLYLVQQLSDVGGKMRDLYERSLLESALLSSRHGHRSAFSPGNGSGDSNQNDGWDHIEMDRFTPFHTLSQETIELIVRVRESSSDIEFIVEENDQVTRQFRQVTTQLQEGLTRTRMVPFAQTADRLPGAVRRIATGLNKQAEIHIEGKDTLIDKMIQEQLFDPMTHLINNAMTHGIETPEKRKKLGKPGVGKITVRAFHQGNQTVISVSDDGAGINTERVKSKALEKGLITPKEAESMSRLDIYDLLFHPGFSTKDKADNFAGRGVGMDVVRVALREIRGVITTDSTEGQGTTFTIRLPLTLSISKALCCISNHARVAFPMDGVEDMLDVPKDRVYANKDGVHCIKWRDTELPFRPLAELLQYNRTIGRGRVFGGSADDDIISIVILRSAGQYLALQVDQVLGEQEIVIKQLEGPIPKPVGVAGATVLGDGRIMPIADVLELIDLSMGRSRRDSRMWEEVVPPEPEPIDKSEPTVLIVDDSITVRELLSMTFVKSGYRVEQARNGLDAWEKLRAGLPCDMIFCDIEMPKLNGLELLERLQGDDILKEIPMAMLTSRGASKYQQHAASLGAKGYFTKPYLEEALLEAAQRMLKGENLLAEISEEQSQETMAGT
ncbi:response regulator, partial [Roseofilum sp. Guam]|uniref:hybrid sensor histidine kinase/response regulator n=1 Tax=Roseofilum sp. Guam TaxID=2821502 RepID=UPI00298E3331